MQRRILCVHRSPLRKEQSRQSSRPEEISCVEVSSTHICCITRCQPDSRRLWLVSMYSNRDVMMGFTALNVLWLISAFTLTRQGEWNYLKGFKGKSLTYGMSCNNVMELVLLLFFLLRLRSRTNVCFSRADVVTLGVTPQITAEHGRPAVLRCNISSELPDSLRVQYMEWSRNKTTLCSVNSQGNVTKHTKHASSDFDCEYKNHQLVLIFNKVQPMERGYYGCKLQSNQGALHQYSRLELEG